VAAAQGALDVLELPAPPRGRIQLGEVHEYELRSISVRAGDRDHLAPADLSLRVRRGKITVLAGPSGTGKTTAMNVSLGLIPADAGQVVLHTASGPVDLADVDLPTWWAQVSWVPQRPTFEPAT